MYVYIYIDIDICAWVCVCCLCIYGFMLTTFYWTTSKGPHSWKRLIIPFPVVISCFYSMHVISQNSPLLY